MGNVLVRRAQKRATWLLPGGGDRRPIAVWISAGGCSRLARNRLLRLPCHDARGCPVAGLSAPILAW